MSQATYRNPGPTPGSTGEATGPSSFLRGARGRSPSPGDRQMWPLRSGWPGEASRSGVLPRGGPGVVLTRVGTGRVRPARERRGRVPGPTPSSTGPKGSEEGPVLIPSWHTEPDQVCPRALGDPVILHAHTGGGGEGPEDKNNVKNVDDSFCLSVYDWTGN